MARKMSPLLRKLSQTTSCRYHSCSAYGYITPSYEIDRPVPVLYPLFREKPLSAVSIGNGFIVGAAPSPTGTVLTAYGANTTLQLGKGAHKTRSFDYQSWVVDESVVRLRSGRAHTLGLTLTGSVFMWGSNNFGQLGKEGVDALPFTTFSHIEVSDIAVGLDNSFLLTKEGHVLSCGWAADGQTGAGTTQTLHTFTEVQVPHPVSSISSSSDTTIVICRNGRVYGWGNNEYHQISPSTEMQMIQPTEIHLPEPVVDVAAGGSFSLFLAVTGNLYSCGFGPGTGLGVDVTVETPTLVVGAGDLEIKSVTASLDHAAGVTRHGEVVTWGRGQHHKLISSHDQDVVQPTLLAELTGVREVVCGPVKTCVLVDEPIKNVSRLGMVEDWCGGIEIGT